MAAEELLIPGPIIYGMAGDIGRSTVQQCLEQNITPAGGVLTERRLETAAERQRTAHEIAHNFAPEGEREVLQDVELKKDILRIGDTEIPVFTPASLHEVLAEGHPVIDATGANTKREPLEGFLEAGASFVVVTSPINQKEGITAVVYGVNSTDERMTTAAEERLLSTSSCTTTAVSSTLGPLLANESLGVKEATVHVSHARTKSNKPEVITNNILTSGSGAAKEIPKVLGTGEAMPFNLACVRANAACGSLFNMEVRLDSTSIDVTAERKKGTVDEETPEERIQRLTKEQILTALEESDSVYLLNDKIKDTKSVIGKQESVVINPDLIDVKVRPDGTIVVNIIGFYDNVSGYTGSMLRGYKGLSAKILELSTSDEASEPTPTAV